MLDIAIIPWQIPASVVEPVRMNEDMVHQLVRMDVEGIAR